jgi:hypothetical protein
MNGYLAQLSLSEIAKFKAYILKRAKHSNFLVCLDVKQKVNQEVFNAFLRKVLKDYFLTKS